MKTNTPILYRDSVESPTEPCPFCNKRHVHGDGDGYRVAHCVTADSKTYFIKTRSAK